MLHFDTDHEGKCAAEYEAVPCALCFNMPHVCQLAPNLWGFAVQLLCKVQLPAEACVACSAVHH